MINSISLKSVHIKENFNLRNEELTIDGIIEFNFFTGNQTYSLIQNDKKINNKNIIDFEFSNDIILDKRDINLLKFNENPYYNESENFFNLIGNWIIFNLGFTNNNSNLNESKITFCYRNSFYDYKNHIRKIEWRGLSDLYCPILIEINLNKTNLNVESIDKNFYINRVNNKIELKTNINSITSIEFVINECTNYKTKGNNKTNSVKLIKNKNKEDDKLKKFVEIINKNSFIYNGKISFNELKLKNGYSEREIRNFIEKLNKNQTRDKYEIVDKDNVSSVEIDLSLLTKLIFKIKKKYIPKILEKILEKVLEYFLQIIGFSVAGAVIIYIIVKL